jgi:phosphopantetheine--protein transferase-like protein
MVARAELGTLGVDIEEYTPIRKNIASAVLTESELTTLSELVGQRRWIATLMRFSIKESIYKAIDPYVHRYVGFHEAQVTPDLHGHATVSLHLARGEGPFIVDARYAWLRGRLLTSVRIRPG